MTITWKEFKEIVEKELERLGIDKETAVMHRSDTTRTTTSESVKVRVFHKDSFVVWG